MELSWTATDPASGHISGTRARSTWSPARQARTPNAGPGLTVVAALCDLWAANAPAPGTRPSGPSSLLELPLVGHQVKVDSSPATMLTVKPVWVLSSMIWNFFVLVAPL